MKTTTKLLGSVGACVLGIACDEAVGRDAGAGAEAARAEVSPSCASLGYEGTCVGDVSVWHEGGACRIRDCAGEGKTCGLISAAAGYGCVEGPEGSSAFDCESLGYDGACLSGDVLAWAEGDACRWADCAASGQACGWTDEVGYDCVQAGAGEGGGDDGAPIGPLVVAGTQLAAGQAKWVRHIAEEIVPQMKGSRADRIAKAAEVTWWSLKEGVLELDQPLPYSNCHFPPDQHIGPIDVCPNPNNAWQVGISGVQAAWRTLEDVEALAASVHPDLSSTEVLVAAAETAGFSPGSATGQAIASSTGRLRLSWLLRDGAVGFEAQYPVVHDECFVQGLYWCFGAGWPSSAAFAPDVWTSEQAVSDLEGILGALAP
jgi:hypothetical protein